MKRHVSSRHGNGTRYVPVEAREYNARAPRSVRGSTVCPPDDDPEEPHIARAAVGKGELDGTRTRVERRENAEVAGDPVRAAEAEAMVARDAKGDVHEGAEGVEDESRGDRS